MAERARTDGFSGTDRRGGLRSRARRLFRASNHDGGSEEEGEQSKNQHASNKCRHHGSFNQSLFRQYANPRRMNSSHGALSHPTSRIAFCGTHGRRHDKLYEFSN